MELLDKQRSHESGQLKEEASLFSVICQCLQWVNRCVCGSGLVSACLGKLLSDITVWPLSYHELEFVSFDNSIISQL